MKRFLALAAALALAGASCSGDDDSDKAAASVLEPGSSTTSTAPPADGPPVGPDITVTATDRQFAAPRVVTGGVLNVTLKNEGKLRHEALIVKVDATPQDTVVEDLNKFVNAKGNAIPGYLDFKGGVGGIAPGSEAKASLKLPPGEYAVVCTLTDLDSVRGAPVPEGANAPEHFTQGMYSALTARTDNAAALPAADGAIVATDYTFQVPPLTAGEHTFVFRNDSSAQLHFASIGAFPEGVDEAAGKKALETIFGATADNPPPAGTPQPEAGVLAGPVGPGGAVTFTVTLQAGRAYAVTCFMSDRAGGLPHAASKKMWTVVTSR